MRDNLTAGMQTAIAAENSSIIHFLEFHFATIKDITGFADTGGGQTTVTCIGHGITIWTLLLYTAHQISMAPMWRL